MTYQPHSRQGVPPAPADGNGSPSQVSRPPGSLTGAFVMTIVVPVVALVLFAFAYVATVDWLAGLADSSTRFLNGERVGERFEDGVEILRPYVHGFFIVLAVIFLVLSLLWILLGFGLRKGSKGIRVVLTVLAVAWLLAGVLMGLASVFGGMWFRSFFAGSYQLELPWTTMLPWGLHGVVAVVGMIAFILLAYRPASSEYVKSVSARKRRPKPSGRV